MIQEVSQQALDLNYDGLIIETHCDPENAWSDAAQQVTPTVLKQIFEDLQAVTYPTIYVTISSKSDPSQAPQGMENWFVLVNAPPTGRVNWQEYAEKYSNLILEKLDGYGVDIRDRIRVKQIITPDDLETRYRTFRGGIYGTSSNTINSAFLRPQNRSNKLRGLYLAGGSAHPGGGLPLVMLSGKLAVQMLTQDGLSNKEHGLLL